MGVATPPTHLRHPMHLIILHFRFIAEFEVNLIVILQDDYVVTENFPISLHRFEE